MILKHHTERLQTLKMLQLLFLQDKLPFTWPMNFNNFHETEKEYVREKTKYKQKQRQE